MEVMGVGTLESTTRRQRSIYSLLIIVVDGYVDNTPNLPFRTCQGPRIIYEVFTLFTVHDNNNTSRVMGVGLLKSPPSLERIICKLGRILKDDVIEKVHLTLSQTIDVW